MEPVHAFEENLAQHDVKRLTQEAMAARLFPPVLQYPESKRGDFLLSTLFSWPVIVWVPECLMPSQKPLCVVRGCTCCPRLREYKQRVVEEVDTKCHLLYIKYQCTGDSKTCFSTVNSSYLQEQAQLILHFPYVLTKKYGLSKDVMELVQEGMLSPHGLSSTVANIKRRREKRYYKLLALFADEVHKRQLLNSTYLAPTPPTAAQYCAKQNPVGAETMSAAWLQGSRIYSSLCEQLMQSLKVKKTLRVDHSVKFCKKLKVWIGGTGKRESMTDAKMLLLLQNEVGQIVGRRLTRSENNDETRELLEHVKALFPKDGDECYIISDNANSIRKMVGDVFGEAAVKVRQDPFHVVQRFTEKIKDRRLRKVTAKRLHAAIYTVDGQLREPVEMTTEVQRALSGISPQDINCTMQEWTGSLRSNVEQIERGDLYVETNTYEEGGGDSVRVLSTSQLEGFHSALKKLLARSVSAEVGLRVLDVFILRHNLTVGSRYGRNPPLQHSDILTLAQTASWCRGIIPDSPELEFVTNLMSTPLPEPKYRSVTDHDFGFEKWGHLFATAHIDTKALELNLHHAQQHSSTIKELLSKQAVFAKTSRLPKSAFFNTLCLTEFDYEAATGFSSEELTLLQQLRAEQAKSARVWADCALVTTVMFNIVATSNPNKHLKLRRRSYTTIAAKLDVIAKLKTEKSKSAVGAKLFRFQLEEPVSDALSGHEQAFQIDLFNALRQMPNLRKKRQVFVRVYDFASCVCQGIRQRPSSDLLSRWENLKRASNRGTSLKIKLKIPPEMLSRKSAQQNLPLAPSPKTAAPKTAPSRPSARIAQSQGSTTPCLEADVVNSAGTQSAPSTSSTDQSRQLHSAQAAFISEENIEKLRKLEADLPNRSGKWNAIYSEYSSMYPNPASRISINALRCRLKSSKARSKRTQILSEQHSSTAPPATKRKRTSCESCRQRKKRCGNLDENPYCTNASTQKDQTSLQQFLSVQ